MLYPIGIQTFEDIRRNGYVYIDKTGLIYRLASTGKHYFLSRPRRFGKSLLISTLEAYFSGKKELFRGLEVEKLEKEWNEYPVLHLDLSGANYSCEQVLRSKLNAFLKKYEEIYDLPNDDPTLSVRFDTLIERIATKTGKKVVVLIDEYEKPIIDNFRNPELQNWFRNELQGFYSVLKSKDKYIRFGFLTGVTRIGKLSIFSGLNNPDDISMNAQFVDICGVSETDLKKYFHESVKELAAASGLSEEGCYKKLAETYDGYHFCENTVGIYNPFSLLKAFGAMKFSEYWFETGTPSFLVDIMRETSFDITQLSDQEADSTLLTDIDAAFENPVPLMYQSGYLTIKGYEPDYQLYHLGFPNMEVKHGFLNFLVRYYTPVSADTPGMLITRMARDINNGDPGSFMKRLEALFAKTSYQIQSNCEKDFQYAMYIILELMGEYATVEHTTSEGRIDILIQTKHHIYIIEIKTNASAAEALAQIEAKNYARQFSADPRKLFKIGVNFSTASRCIDDWEVI